MFGALFAANAELVLQINVSESYMHSIFYINHGVPRNNKFWKTTNSLVLLTLLGGLNVT